MSVGGVPAYLFIKADWAHYFRNVMVKLIEHGQTSNSRYHLIHDDAGRDIICLNDSDEEECDEEKQDGNVDITDSTQMPPENEDKSSPTVETHNMCSSAIGRLNSHSHERIGAVVSGQDENDTRKTSFISGMVGQSGGDKTSHYSINTSNLQNMTPIQNTSEKYLSRRPISLKPRSSCTNVVQSSLNNAGAISRISAMPSQYVFEQDRAINRDTGVTQSGGWLNNGTPRFLESPYSMQVSTTINSPGVTTFQLNSTPSVVPMDNVAAAFMPTGKCQPAPTSPIVTEDLLYENYNKTNAAVSQMEQSIMLSNQQIMKLSRCNILHAQQLMKQCKQTQRKLRVLIMSRDICVVNIILQSPRVMQNIHQLRLQTLSDVAQVTSSCHQKCARLAEQMQLGETHLVGLNQKMEELVNHDFSLPDYHKKVLELHQKIEEIQHSLVTWKTEREHELVRIVHYSRQIRDLLKQQFQRHQTGSSVTAISTFPMMGTDSLN